MGVTIGNLARILDVPVTGRIEGDWMSESNLYTRLVLTWQEGSHVMNLIHKSLYLLQDPLILVGTLYQVQGKSETGCSYYQVQKFSGNLALLSEEGKVLTLYRPRLS